MIINGDEGAPQFLWLGLGQKRHGVISLAMIEVGIGSDLVNADHTHPCLSNDGDHQTISC